MLKIFIVKILEKYRDLFVMGSLIKLYSMFKNILLMLIILKKKIFYQIHQIKYILLIKK